MTLKSSLICSGLIMSITSVAWFCFAMDILLDHGGNAWNLIKVGLFLLFGSASLWCARTIHHVTPAS